MKKRGKGKKPKISCPERMAFLQQRIGAKKRGIGFEFTYEQWIIWWKKHLGDNWFEKRGRGSHQYVMARYGDKGPYSLTNVRCATGAQNRNEGLSNKDRRYAKLTEEQVRIIYLKIKNGPRGTALSMAEKFKVTDGTVWNIARKLTWRHVTDLLD